MSDTVAPAAAPVAAPNATPAPAPEAPKGLKVKNLEFKSEDEAYAEIERGRQSGKILTQADKRLQEAVRKEKEQAELFGEVKTKKDAKKLIERLGLSKDEAVEVFGKWLYENEVLPKELSPDQRLIRELQAEKAKAQEEREAGEKAVKAKQHEELTQQEAHKIRKEIEGVLATKKIPGTRLALRRMAGYLASYAEAGADIPMERAADLVAEDYKQEFGELFDDASADQLMEFFGKERWHKIGKKVSDWALAQSRGKIPPAPQDPIMRAKPNASTENKMTPHEFQKMLRGLK